MIETLKFMLEQLIPEDNAQDDTDRHKNVRRLTEKPIETNDDKGFTHRTKSGRFLKVSIPGKHQSRTELQVKF